MQAVWHCHLASKFNNYVLAVFHDRLSFKRGKPFLSALPSLLDISSLESHQIVSDLPLSEWLLTRSPAHRNV
jgi:hypothetical protein